MKTALVELDERQHGILLAEVERLLTTNPPMDSREGVLAGVLLQLVHQFEQQVYPITRFDRVASLIIQGVERVEDAYTRCFRSRGS